MARQRDELIRLTRGMIRTCEEHLTAGRSLSFDKRRSNPASLDEKNEVLPYKEQFLEFVIRNETELAKQYDALTIEDLKIVLNGIPEQGQLFNAHIIELLRIQHVFETRDSVNTSTGSSWVLATNSEVRAAIEQVRSCLVALRDTIDLAEKSNSQDSPIDKMDKAIVLTIIREMTAHLEMESVDRHHINNRGAELKKMGKKVLKRKSDDWAGRALEETAALTIELAKKLIKYSGLGL